MSSTELSVLPVILRKPMWRASASRFRGPRRSRTEASSLLVEREEVLDLER